MGTALVAIALAFVYTLLVTAAIGVVLILLDIDLSAERWGFKIPVVVFLLLLWPSVKYARTYVAAMDEERKNKIASR